MNKFSKIRLGIALNLSAIALSLSATSLAEPVMNLVTVNTQDGAGYAAWAKGSAEAISKSNNAMSMGLCSPMTGAEQMGDHFLFTFLIPKKQLGRTAQPTQRW